MFIRVDKKPLLDALLPALCAVSNKSTIAALSCVFLHADEENSTLTITGFDINKGLKTSIPATVLEGGNLLLEGHKFASIVRSLPDTEVSVQNDDRYITTISCQKSRFEIRRCNAAFVRCRLFWFCFRILTGALWYHILL